MTSWSSESPVTDASLLAVVAEEVQTAEALRRVPDRTIEAARASGFLRSLQPARYGGREASPLDFFEAIVEIAAVCGSTGWVLSVLGVHSWQIGLFAPEAQDEVWGEDPDVLIASSFAPKGRVETVPGGFRLSGHWSFSSGCDHCGWVLLGGVAVAADGTPDFRTFLVPAGDFAIDDDWHVLGLVGSGSKSIVVDQAFVPAHRTLGAMDVFLGNVPGMAVNPAPLFRFPLPTLFGWSIAAPAIGVARGALGHYVEALRERLDAYAGTRVVEDPFAQVRLARATAEIDAAQARLRATLGATEALLAAGERPDLESRSRVRWDAADAVTRAVRATDWCFEGSGGSAIRLSNPIQRCFRDVHAMRAHAINDPEAAALIYAQRALDVGEINPFV